jgi:3D (Asp-Asp-Asp) domain-containing protein
MDRYIKKYKRKIGFIVFISILFHFIGFPLPTLANIGNNTKLKDPATNNELYYTEVPEMISINEFEDDTTITGVVSEKILENLAHNNNARLPENQNLPSKPKIVKDRLITAYTSEAAQCDASPCITASGFNVCKHGIEDTVAANFLPFGAKIKIPELFGEKILIVRDRTSLKYGNRVDVWMKSKNAAIKFGIRYSKIEILK